MFARMVAGVNLDEVAMPNDDGRGSSDDEDAPVDPLSAPVEPPNRTDSGNSTPPPPSLTTQMETSLNRVLSFASLQSFHSQLSQAVSQSHRRTLLQSCADEALQRFLDDYCAADRFAPKFVQQVAGMWIAFDVREHSLDVLDLKVAVERRRLMLTNAAAWLWLTNDCVRAIRLYLEDKPEDAIIDDEPDGWLQRLTRQIYIWRVRDEIGKIDPHQYLSNDHRDAPSVTIPRPQGRPHSSVTDWVVEQVIRVVRVWTRFPTNTRLLAAHFVCHIIRLFRNSDVLLLPHMWRMHQNIKTEVLNAGNIRHTSLTVAMLSPVIHALSNHPLAATDSPESVLMEKISKLVEVCMPRVRDLGIQMFMSLDVLDPERLSLPPISLAPTRPLISAGVGKGMDALLKFVRELLPLVDGGTLHLPSNATKLQHLVMSRPDFYCPFRELAPSRRIFTGSDGPFHANQCELPGAFASWILSRTALFESPMVGRHTSGFFADQNAWNDFLEACGYDGTVPSARQIVNIACYGTPQPQRCDVLNQAERYFAAEAQWQKFVQSHHPNKIPFLDMYLWLQTKTRPSPKTISRSLPQVGKLTAYLLAADLVYCGKVEMPDPACMGRLIAMNQLGSLKGLVSAGALPNGSTEEADVIAAFKVVYKAVEAEIGSMGKVVGMDVIMVEHLLCKFQRVQRKSL